MMPAGEIMGDPVGDWGAWRFFHISPGIRSRSGAVGDVFA
jgi:hypothetical protein